MFRSGINQGFYDRQREGNGSNSDEGRDRYGLNSDQRFLEHGSHLGPNSDHLRGRGEGPNFDQRRGGESPNFDQQRRGGEGPNFDQQRRGGEGPDFDQQRGRNEANSRDQSYSRDSSFDRKSLNRCVEIKSFLSFLQAKSELLYFIIFWVRAEGSLETHKNLNEK